MTAVKFKFGIGDQIEHLSTGRLGKVKGIKLELGRNWLLVEFASEAVRNEWIEEEKVAKATKQPGNQATRQEVAES